MSVAALHLGTLPAVPNCPKNVLALPSGAVTTVTVACAGDAAVAAETANAAVPAQTAVETVVDAAVAAQTAVRHLHLQSADAQTALVAALLLLQVCLSLHVFLLQKSAPCVVEVVVFAF